jgi:hypothetical protein
MIDAIMISNMPANENGIHALEHSYHLLVSWMSKSILPHLMHGSRFSSGFGIHRKLSEEQHADLQ